MSQKVEINAALVKQLRDKTGAGISDCKKSLEESAGDLKKAEELLRSKGVKVSVTTRATAEGTLVVRTSHDGRAAALIELKCETDFSARNTGFQALAGRIADAVLKAGVPDAAQAQKLPVEGAASVEAAIQQEMTIGVRENVRLEWVEFKKLDGPGRIGSYVHSNNKLAVLVGLRAPNDAAVAKPEFAEVAKDVAMHVAGHVPAAVAVDRKGVPQDIVETERRIILKHMDDDPKDAKKPPQVKEKIVDGKMGKFYKERVLLEQQFVKDENQTVEQLLANTGKAIGGAPAVAWFTRRQLGGQ